MSARSAIRHEENTFYKWFGANRGTHWSIAGSLAVIIFGGYLIYNYRDNNCTTATTIPATEGTPAPMTPEPLTLKK